MPSWRAALGVYLDRRMWVILGMGLSSGLPFWTLGSTLSYWLARSGVDKTSIGLLSLVGLAYTLKFLWAPLLDHVALPLLGRRLGRRRSWVLVCQLGLAGAILALGGTDPARAPLATAAWALAIAFLSATQDIAIDAYRIEILSEREQGAGASATQTGYSLARLVSAAGAIALADVAPWPTVFAILATLMLLGAALVLSAPEPVQAPAASPAPASFAERFAHAVLAPLHEMLAWDTTWPASRSRSAPTTWRAVSARRPSSPTCRACAGTSSPRRSTRCSPRWRAGAAPCLRLAAAGSPIASTGPRSSR